VIMAPLATMITSCFCTSSSGISWTSAPPTSSPCEWCRSPRPSEFTRRP
jgi:hypothetical protein